MVTQTRTLLLLGITLAPLAALSGCIIDTSDNGVHCADNQFFSVQWEVDTGTGTPMLLCAQTPPSYVELETNTGLFLDVVGTCVDGTLYNWRGSSIAGLAVGTRVIGADLVSSVDGRTLSGIAVPPSAQLPIGSCSQVLHTFEFPIAP